MKTARKFAFAVIGGAAALAGSGVFAQQCTIKIGRVVPVTGPLADVGKDTP